MSRSHSSQARREDPEEGEVFEGPVQAGPSRLPAKTQPKTGWVNPLEIGMKRQSSYSPKKGDTAKLPPKPAAEQGFPSSSMEKSGRKRSPLRSQEDRDLALSDEWVEKDIKMAAAISRDRAGDGSRDRSGDQDRDGDWGGDRDRDRIRDRDRNRDRQSDPRRRDLDRRDEYSDWDRDRGARSYRPRDIEYGRPNREDGYGRSPRRPNRYESNGGSRYSPPQRDYLPRDRDWERERQYSGRKTDLYSGSGRERTASGNTYGNANGWSGRNERGDDRYTGMYDDDVGEGRRYRSDDSAYASSRHSYDRDHPRARSGDQRRLLSPPRNGSNGEGFRLSAVYHDDEPVPKRRRSTQPSTPPPPEPPRTPQEEGEVSSPAPPPPPSDPPSPPESDKLAELQASESYKPKKILRHTSSNNKLRMSPRPPSLDQAQPPSPGDDTRPHTPPTPPPPFFTPPPPPPEPDRGPNPYLSNYKPVNKALEETKYRAPVDISKAPTGPRIDPSRGSGGHAPDRDAMHPSTRPASPVPGAKPERREPERFLMWTEQQEREKLGRIFEGTTTLDDYNLGTKLGEGTFGVVTKAVERGSGKVVALKKLITHNPRDGVSVTTVREIKILKALEHENVVPIRAMVVQRKQPTDRTERGEVFMVFPYMDHDLCGLLANTAFSVTQSLAKLLLRQILEGLAYIHSQNIVHRDIKTANILVGRTGLVMIADFGLARAWTPKDTMPPHAENEYTNMVVTRWYRAPELLLGSTRYGPEIDIWSTGCVFGEMYMRQPVLCGESDRDQLYKIAQRCGPLDEESFPGWQDLPGFPDAAGHPWDKTPQTQSLFEEVLLAGSLSRMGQELMAQLMRLDPTKRVSASDALSHPWFWTSPLPGEPKEGLITVDSSHEFTTRRPEKPAPVPPPRHQPVHHAHQNRPFGQRRPQPTLNLSAPGTAGPNTGFAHGGPSLNQSMPPHQQYQHQHQHSFPQQGGQYGPQGGYPPAQNPHGAPIHANASQMPMHINGNGYGHGHGPHGQLHPHDGSGPGSVPALAPNGYPVGMPPPILPGSLPINPNIRPIQNPAVAPPQSGNRAHLPPPAPFALAGPGANANLPNRPGHVPPAPFALRGAQQPGSYAEAVGGGGWGGDARMGGMKRGPPGPLDRDAPREDKRPKPTRYED